MDKSISVHPLVDGRALRSSSQTFEIINPSTGAWLFSVSEGTSSDVEQAVASARACFDDGRWRDSAPSLRKKILHRWADLIAQHAAALDELDAEEMGKPVSLSFCNAAAASVLVRFYAEAIDKLTGDVFSSDKFSLVTQRRVPRGVVAAIVPWNFPTFNALLKSAPALAAGNSVVLKPSELSSRSAFRLTQLALEAGMPPGALNFVPGLGQTVGEALALHPQVDMIAFTGSSAVGKRMLQYAGQSNMKVVMAECGGKSPQIVFNDGVDLDAAADHIAQLILRNQGQVCSIGTRLLVQRSIEAVLIERIVPRLKRINVGNALNTETTFGPLVSAKQRDRVMSYIEEAPSEGAECVTGGRRLLPDSGGFYVEPTMFRKVAPNARIAQEEIFGPVLSVTAFSDEAEAIKLANSTSYGLSAYVWCTQLGTAMRVAKGILSTVFVNTCAPQGEGAGRAASHEPVGLSGIGVESGLAGMEAYMRRQLVAFNHG